MTQPTLVVATDLTDASRRVLELAQVWAKGLGARVLLVHALDRPEAPYPVPEALAAFMDDRRSARASHDEGRLAEVTRQRDRLREAGVACDAELGDGRAWQVIGDVARAAHASLIVLGDHGDDGAPEGESAAWLERALGSTVDRVIRTAPCPVLVASGRGPLPRSLEGTRWVVGTDFSPSSIVAMEVADELRRRLGAALEVAHVLEAKAGADGGAAEAQFAEFVRLNAPGAEARLVWREAPAALALCAVAEEGGAQVLVVGTHGMSAREQLVVGSTGERCLRRAPLPLMLVPMRAAT